MNPSQLVSLGLTEPLAKTYLYLLQNGPARPPQVAVQIRETRTNTYSLLDKLVELKLAHRYEVAKKVTYEAEPPVALERYVQAQREEIARRERSAQAILPSLLNMYQAANEKPGVRFYQGKEGIKKIYEEQIAESQPIDYIRTRAEIDLLGFRFTHNIRVLAPQAGIHRHAFTPDSPEVPVDYRESDARYLLNRTWYQPDDYTAPVEWSVFGSKVAAISFGKEAIGMIIDSPQIAESMRQIFALLDEGLRRRPDYDTLPRLAEFTDVDSFVAKHNDRAPKLPAGQKSEPGPSKQ